MSKSKNVLFIFTGSIACYKACTVLSKLKQQGYHLKVVMSPSAQAFVGAATIEGLTGELPVTDTFAGGHAMDHINLIRWADVVLVAPATANYINKISAGIGDDLLTTLFLAHDFAKPFLLAPAMNTKMYLHPVTQNSIKHLKSLGVDILETASGVLACGEVGWGRLLEPDLIFQEVEAALNRTTIGIPSVKQGGTKAPSDPIRSHLLNVLITSGGTSEDIDDVRVITNKSTGKTAATIADSLIESGFNVTYLHSQTAARPRLTCEQAAFTTFGELDSSLSEQLKNKNFYAVIHAAAVSDYSIAKQNGKISSQADELQLTLKRNPKIINQIKKWSPASKLIGFKLTSGADDATVQQKVDTLFEQANCDYIVQNDWKEKIAGKPNFRIYKRENHTQFETAADLSDLNAHLFQILSKETL